jgi:hypothetical protein
MKSSKILFVWMIDPSDIYCSIINLLLGYVLLNNAITLLNAGNLTLSVLLINAIYIQ